MSPGGEGGGEVQFTPAHVITYVTYVTCYNIYTQLVASEAVTITTKVLEIQDTFSSF